GESTNDLEFEKVGANVVQNYLAVGGISGTKRFWVEGQHAFLEFLKPGDLFGDGSGPVIVQLGIMDVDANLRGGRWAESEVLIDVVVGELIPGIGRRASC